MLEAIISMFLVVLIVTFFIFNNKKPIKKKEKNIDIEDLFFPKEISNLDRKALVGSIKIISDSFRCLEYSKKGPSLIDKKEWHSWQVSLLLCSLKNYIPLYLSDLNDIIPKSILSLSEKEKKEELERIYKKYYEKVDITKKRDDLSKDIVWSAREVSFILLKLAKN